MAGQSGNQVTKADAELIADVLERGFEVKSRQLKELRAKRLIATPDRQEQGRKGGRPSDSYPAGTAERVAQICRLRKATPKPSYDDLPILLFLDGSNDDLAAAKARTLVLWNKIAEKYPKREDAEGGPEAITKFQRTASRDPVLRTMRDGVGVGAIRRESRFDRTLAVWLNSTIGIEPKGQQMTDLLRLLDLSGVGDPNLLRTMVLDSNVHEWATKLSELGADELIWARDFLPKLCAILAIASQDDPASEAVAKILQLQHITTYLDVLESMMGVAIVAYFRPLFASAHHASIEAIRAKLHAADESD